MYSVDTPSFFKLDRRYFPSSSLPCRASRPVCTVQRKRPDVNVTMVNTRVCVCVCVCVVEVQ